MFDFLFLPPVLAFIPIAAALIGSSLIGAGASAYGAKKAADAAKSVKPVDIGKLAADARENAETNLRQSLQLESQYLPGQAAARAGVGDALAGSFSGASQQAREQALMGMLGLAQRGGVSNLTRSATDQLMADLELGGNLDPETQAAVMRGALARTGASGITGSQAGRGLTARDLGLTSMQLRNSRIANALQGGQMLSQAEMASQMGLQQLVGAQTGDAMAAQQILAGMLPEAGLSSGDLASVTIGNNQQQNQARIAASQAQAAGVQGVASSLASGLGLLGRLGGAPSTTTTSASQPDPASLTFNSRLAPLNTSLFGP